MGFIVDISAVRIRNAAVWRSQPRLRLAPPSLLSFIFAVLRDANS